MNRAFKKSKELFLTKLRDKKTSTVEFRKNARILASLLAQEALSIVEKESIDLETPFEKTIGTKIKPKITLVPILRSGMSMLEPFLEYFEDAQIGVVGLKRGEKSAIARLYYQNIPQISSRETIIILDPMIATGGTGSATIKILLDLGAKQENIIFASIINAQDGINKIKERFPEVTIIQAGIDANLNKDKFITPGLGDFGDRYYGK